MLRAVDGHNRDELREQQVHAVELVDRHLELLQVGGTDAVLELAHHELLVQAILLGEVGRVDRLEALRKACASFFCCMACATVKSLKRSL